MLAQEFFDEDPDFAGSACVKFIAKRHESIAHIAIDPNDKLAVFFIFLFSRLVFGHAVSQIARITFDRQCIYLYHSKRNRCALFFCRNPHTPRDREYDEKRTIPKDRWPMRKLLALSRFQQRSSAQLKQKLLPPHPIITHCARKRRQRFPHLTYGIA